MTKWPSVALGDVLTAASNRITLDPDATYSQVTARLWGKGLTLRAQVKGAEISATQQNAVSAGQFVISKIDARHGAFGIVPDELDGAVVSNDFPSFDVDCRRALPDYIAWVSRTSWFIALCKRASEGSTNRVRLKEARFLAQQIPLPTLAEQRQIVEHLNAAAEAIRVRTLAAIRIEAEVAAALRTAFVRVIDGAPRVAMAEIAPLVRRPVTIDFDASYPELGVRSFGKGTFHKPSLPGIEVGSKKLFRVESGDLVFNIVFAWEGAVAVARPEDVGRVGSHRFLPCAPDTRRTTSQFLRYWFLSEEGLLALARASPGGAGRNRTLGTKALERINVPLPPLGCQQWFNQTQAKAQAARMAQAKASEHLEALLPSILDQTFKA